MNIFALSDDPRLAAIWQHDRHVNKMIVESAQLLSAVCHTQPEYMARVLPHHVPLLYKVSHKNNPLTLWAGASEANFVWLAIHLTALVGEKHRRFPLNGMHKTYPLAVAFGSMAARIVGVERMFTRDDERNTLIDPAIIALAKNHTPFYLAMPDEYKIESLPGYLQNTGRTVEVYSYRNLYARVKIFQDHVKWTNCASIPEFLVEPFYSSAVSARIENLMEAHARAGTVRPHPLLTHPDLLKPTNPKALTRFGSRSTQ